MKPEPRRVVPIKVQLEVAKRQLAALMREKGFEVERLELDHDPALGLRPIDPETGEHVPHQHDASCLVWRPDAEHKVKTTGRRGESDLSLTFNGDQSRIAKTERVQEREAEFRRQLLARAEGKPVARKGSIPSRPKQPAKPQNRASGFRPLRFAALSGEQP
ncbi:hypothetical protein [uncultured Enterovirga sp.]|uniref:hypothetical protein n=1 Tax=uncultured Enterovirga sp. TaxID=2026352 RepID=UPI0035CAFECB